MEELRRYLNSLPRPEQEAFAARCGTTLGYLRKASYVGARFNSALSIAIERESCGAVTCEMLNPAADWSYIRGTEKAEA